MLLLVRPQLRQSGLCDTRQLVCTPAARRGPSTSPACTPAATGERGSARGARRESALPTSSPPGPAGPACIAPPPVMGENHVPVFGRGDGREECVGYAAGWARAADARCHGKDAPQPAGLGPQSGHACWEINTCLQPLDANLLDQLCKHAGITLYGGPCLPFRAHVARAGGAGGLHKNKCAQYCGSNSVRSARSAAPFSLAKGQPNCMAGSHGQEPAMQSPNARACNCGCLSLPLLCCLWRCVPHNPKRWSVGSTTRTPQPPAGLSGYPPI